MRAEAFRNVEPTDVGQPLRARHDFLRSRFVANRSRQLAERRHVRVVAGNGFASIPHIGVRRTRLTRASGAASTHCRRRCENNGERTHDSARSQLPCPQCRSGACPQHRKWPQLARCPQHFFVAASSGFGAVTTTFCGGGNKDMSKVYRARSRHAIVTVAITAANRAESQRVSTGAFLWPIGWRVSPTLADH